MAVVSALTSAGKNVISKFLMLNPAYRGIATSAVRSQAQGQAAKNETENVEEEEDAKPKIQKRLVTDAESSIRYMESKAYSEAYGDKPVWFYYRRNFKGQRAPETRKTCIRGGQISTGSPCPICRDEHLLVDYRNTKLLEQFLSPYTGEVLESKKTGVCQKQHKKLLVEVMKAHNQGLLEKNIPFRIYDYSEYWDSGAGQPVY